MKYERIAIFALLFVLACSSVMAYSYVSTFSTGGFSIPAVTTTQQVVATPASIAVIEAKTYDKNWVPVSRPYLLPGDWIVAELEVEGSLCNLALRSNGAGSVGCYRSGSNYKCNFYVSKYIEPGEYTFYANGRDCRTYPYQYVTSDNFLTANINPQPTLAVSEPIVFGQLVEGTTVNSNQVAVSAEGAKLYVKAAKYVLSSTYPSLCAGSNRFPPNNIQFSTNGGATWQVLSRTNKYIGTSSANIQFRAIVPSSCYGTFDIAKVITFSAVMG